MAINPAQRIAKWDAKFKTDRVKAVLDDERPNMYMNVQAVFPLITAMELQVKQVLDGLVSERLVDLEAKRLGIRVSDDALARAVATSPDYQDNGQFIGTDEIRRRLDLQGLSEEDFERSLRQQVERVAAPPRLQATSMIPSVQAR